MGLKFKRAWCPCCQDRVMAMGEAPNHLLHFVVTILSGGLWIFGWIFISIDMVGRYRCTQCNTAV